MNIFMLLCFIIGFDCCYCFIEGLYCGKENCYEVLDVTRDTPKPEIGKAYRKLAFKYHPDRHKSKEQKEKAAERFTVIATAYEVLKDEESRKDYDYMLDNPDEIYRHYYSYYRRRLAPKVDVRIVVVVTVTVISILQYLAAKSRYKSALDYLVTVPKYRIKAVEIAKKDGLLNDSQRRKDRRSKEVIKTEEEQILKKIIEEKMDIRGGYSKPSLKSTLWVQIVLLPYTVTSYCWWNLWWLWRFTLRGEEYGMEEKLYLIRSNMNISSYQWEGLPDDEKDEMLAKELWIKDKFKAWKEQKDMEVKAKLAESSRYKSYRRYMKNHGPGQITFDD